MRILYALTVLTFSFFTANAQISLEETAIESNPELKRLHHKSQVAHTQKLKRLFGTTPTADSRSTEADCEDDGVYENGESVYILSGDSLRICFDTTGLVSMTNLSVEGNFGTTTIDTNCIVYHAFENIDLGLGDTIIIELCLPDNNGCFNQVFPVIVKRENRVFVEDETTLITQDEAILCADPANIDLPDGIFTSEILDCHDLELAEISNGNKKDSCVLLTAQRFAGVDTACVQISNAYCICDSFLFPFRVIGDTLELPFMDDFSYAGPYPGKEWLDIHTFVNTRWSRESPSVGFATFDALDATGTPYGFPYGRADYLTSNYINLESGNDIFLSFYVEPKGLGYEPNAVDGDSLILEFKNEFGDWVNIDTYLALGNIDIDDVPPWKYKTYEITSPEFLYKGFQFRFVNYSSGAGILDIWHVDYVKLDANESPDSIFEDVAFTQIPNSILKRYSHMPYRHFEGNEAAELIDEIDIELYSQFAETVLVEPSDLTITETMNDVEVHYDGTLLEDPVTQRNVPSHEHKHHVNPINFAPFPALSGDSLIFETVYTFDVSAQNPGQFPMVTRNDTVRHKTYMTNFFSRDDGSAETAMNIGLSQGWAIAVEFEANIDDSLRAIQVHFPHFSGANQSNLKFNIQIFTGELNDTPVYEKLFVEPFYADLSYDTLQGYTTYKLSDDFGNPKAVFIPQGKFYVALQQANAISDPSSYVRIGLDKNSPEAKPYQYVFDNANWLSLANNGAAMLRAVVGDYTPGNTATTGLSDSEERIKIFPNPSTGILNFEFENGDFNNYEVAIFNTVGQLVFQQKLDATTIDLSNQNDGMYFIKIMNLKTKTSSVDKVFIGKQR